MMVVVVVVYKPIVEVYTNSFVTFLSWIYWLDTTHAFNAAGGPHGRAVVI